jgi:hypothetical protein
MAVFSQWLLFGMKIEQFREKILLKKIEIYIKWGYFKFLI